MKIQMLGLPALAVVAVAVTLVVSGCAQQDAGHPALLEVESTTFSHIGYDPTAQQLTVVFRDGGETYVYKDISVELYQGLIAADSVGAYYHQNIRDKFQFDRK